MKRSNPFSRSRRYSSFTLVELLVVMGIIAILAGVLFAAGGAAIRSAQRARAAVIANTVLTAVQGYYTEYSVYPVPSDATASQDYLLADTDAAHWKAEIYGLCGNINPYDSTTNAPTSAVANTRAVPYLNLKKSDVDSSGGLKNPLPTGTSIYFNLAIDYDYDNIVGDSGTASGKLPDFVNSTTTSLSYLATGTTAGAVVWANCNASTNSTNPSFYVHTY